MSQELALKVKLLMNSPTFVGDLKKTAETLKLDKAGIDEVILRTANAMNLESIVKQAAFVPPIFFSAGTNLASLGKNALGAASAIPGKAIGGAKGLLGKGQDLAGRASLTPLGKGTAMAGAGGIGALLGNLLGQGQGSEAAQAAMMDEATRTGGGALGGGALGAGLGNLIGGDTASTVGGGALGAGLGGVAGHYSPDIMKALGLA
jgi:hypothetical protein